MGILTVMCYEQAQLFEYFSASGSQAGCSFVKALYCISFLCQSPFPVAVLCQTTMTLRFLRVAWRQACHEPQGLTASHWTTSQAPSPSGLSAFKSFPPPCPHWITLFPCPTFSLIPYLPVTAAFCSFPPPSVHFSPTSSPVFSFTTSFQSFAPFSSVFPSVRTSSFLLHPFFPPPFVPLSRSEEGLSDISCARSRSRPHLARGFLQLLSETPYRNTQTCTLLSAYIHITWSYCTQWKYMVVFGNKLWQHTAELAICRKKRNLWETVGNSIENTGSRHNISAPSRISKNKKNIFTYSE